jgi:hypothetical protein
MVYAEGNSPATLTADITLCCDKNREALAHSRLGEPYLTIVRALRD